MAVPPGKANSILIIDMLDEYLARIKVVHEADPDLSCPIDLPEKDVPVLMAAICAGADYLLTGDLKHFGTYFGKTVMGVQILMPRDYLLPRIQRQGTRN